jgi:iron complex transport system permease protein
LKNTLSIVFLLFLLLLFAFWGIQIGSFETQISDVVNAIFNYDSANNLHFSIIHLRMPRILLALVAGASLALCGYVFQILLNNPLADPYIIGTASGASLGANLAYFGLVPMMFLGIYMPLVLAFVGSMLVTLLVTVLATRGKMLIPSYLILGGIALNTFIGAIISLITFLSDSDGKLKSIIFWMMGGFEKASWSNITIPIIVLLLVGSLFMMLSKQLTILMIGEEQAENLGLNVNKTRWMFLIGGALVTSFSVAISGPIGFVGLIIPHFVRSVWGSIGRYNLLYSMLLGGILLEICDILSRYLLFPSGIPVGIVTSFMGVPFFMYMLFKSKYRFY